MTIKRSRQIAKRKLRKRRGVEHVNEIDAKTKETSATHIATVDFRYEFISTIAKDFIGPAGIKHSAGTVVEISAQTKRGNDTLNFPMPSMVGLYTDMSHKAFVDGEILWASVKFTEHINNKGLFSLKEQKETTSILFDALEKRIASIIFAFSALEAFLNQSIPGGDYQYSRKGKKSTELMDKEQIERWVTTEEKLTSVLPEIKGIASPSSIASWSVFKQLKKDRDRLIHLKHKDLMNQLDTDTIWESLVKDDFPHYAKLLRPIFEHFHPDEKARPRWMLKAPYWINEG